MEVSSSNHSIHPNTGSIHPNTGGGQSTRLECAVCSRRFGTSRRSRQPVVALCGHSFCWRCSRNLTRCFTCRAIQRVQGVKNYALIDCLDELRDIKEKMARRNRQLKDQLEAAGLPVAASDDESEGSDDDDEEGEEDQEEQDYQGEQQEDLGGEEIEDHDEELEDDQEEGNEDEIVLDIVEDAFQEVPPAHLHDLEAEDQQAFIEGFIEYVHPPYQPFLLLANGMIAPLQLPQAPPLIQPVHLLQPQNLGYRVQQPQQDNPINLLQYYPNQTVKLVPTVMTITSAGGVLMEIPMFITAIAF